MQEALCNYIPEILHKEPLYPCLSAHPPLPLVGAPAIPVIPQSPSLFEEIVKFIKELASFE
jgi:hypothetical protein